MRPQKIKRQHLPPKQRTTAMRQVQRSAQNGRHKKLSTLETPKRKESTVALRNDGTWTKAEHEGIAKSGISSRPRRTSRTTQSINAQRQAEKQFVWCGQWIANVDKTGRAAAQKNAVCSKPSQFIWKRSHKPFARQTKRDVGGQM